MTDKNGTREIDLGPVNKYVELLTQSFGGKYPLMNKINSMELFDLVQSMNAEQLRYLVAYLESSLREKVRENRYLHTKAGIKTICRLRCLVKQYDKKLGHDSLWTESNELRE